MPGATKLGSCLIDATRGDRARRTVRVLAAMLRSERATQQSSRPFDPVVSLRPPCPTRVHGNSGPMSWIVKKSIGAVPRKIFAHLAVGTGTISQDGFCCAPPHGAHHALHDVILRLIRTSPAGAVPPGGCA